MWLDWPSSRLILVLSDGFGFVYKYIYIRDNADVSCAFSVCLCTAFIQVKRLSLLLITKTAVYCFYYASFCYLYWKLESKRKSNVHRLRDLLITLYPNYYYYYEYFYYILFHMYNNKMVSYIYVSSCHTKAYTIHVYVCPYRMCTWGGSKIYSW